MVDARNVHEFAAAFRSGDRHSGSWREEEEKELLLLLSRVCRSLG